MGYVLSEKRFRVSRAEFERSISGASKDTQARYLRDYERYHREMPAKAVPRPVGASKAPSRVQVPSGGVKRSKPAAGASERYVLSEERFKEGYDVFKARMKDLPKATQERYGVTGTATILSNPVWPRQRPEIVSFTCSRSMPWTMLGGRLNIMTPMGSPNLFTIRSTWMTNATWTLLTLKWSSWPSMMRPM